MTSNNSYQVFKYLDNRIKAAAYALPKLIGAEVVRYSNQRFSEGGWDGEPWPRRKPGAKNNSGRALLVNTGRLRKSVRVISATPESVTVGSDVPYARIHNEGFSGTENVKAHTRQIKFKTTFLDLSTPVRGKNKFKTRHAKGIYETKVKAFVRRMRMPRRRFLGDSPYLRRNMERIVTAEFIKALKQ